VHAAVRLRLGAAVGVTALITEHASSVDHEHVIGGREVRVPAALDEDRRRQLFRELVRNSLRSGELDECPFAGLPGRVSGDEVPRDPLEPKIEDVDVGAGPQTLGDDRAEESIRRNVEPRRCAQLSPPKMPDTDSSSKTARIASEMICPTERTTSFSKPFSGGTGSVFVTTTLLSGEFCSRCVA
jgi:hypothetical protein